MTRGSPRTELHLVGTPPAHDGRRLAWLSGALAATATGVGATLAAAGAPWPSPGALALFALLGWFAVNRYTFFPSELAVTSESAVLLAAVVAFHREAPLLGPWCVAALLGPLDAVHWEQRAFSRMGFNAAHQMLAVVAAGAACTAVSPATGAAAPTPLGAGLAVVTYAAVVWVAGVVALRLWAHLSLRVAVQRLLALDWLVVPLAVLGAVAGVAAVDHGWWALPVVLVPAAFVPELVVGRGRSPSAAFVASRAVRVVVGAAAGAAVLAPVLGVALGGWAPAALGVVALAGLAACELRRRPSRFPPLFGVVTAVGAAAIAAGPPWWSPLRSGGALAIGALVAGAAVLSAPAGARLRELARLGWALPLFAIGVAAALLVVRAGAATVAMPVAVVAASAALIATWAAPPWSSRVLAHALAGRLAARRAVLAAFVVIGVGTATAAARVADDAGLARACLAVAALVALEVALAVAAAGARQWRLAPLPRRAVATFVAVVAVALLVAFPLLARHAPEWVAPVAVAAAVVAVVAGDAPARRGDHADRLPR